MNATAFPTHLGAWANAASVVVVPKITVRRGAVLTPCQPTQVRRLRSHSKYGGRRSSRRGGWLVVDCTSSPLFQERRRPLRPEGTEEDQWASLAQRARSRW